MLVLAYYIENRFNIPVLLDKLGIPVSIFIFDIYNNYLNTDSIQVWGRFESHLDYLNVKIEFSLMFRTEIFCYLFVKLYIYNTEYIYVYNTE